MTTITELSVELSLQVGKCNHVKQPDIRSPLESDVNLSCFQFFSSFHSNGVSTEHLLAFHSVAVTGRGPGSRVH